MGQGIAGVLSELAGLVVLGVCTSVEGACILIRGSPPRLVVLDEITYPLRYGWVPLDPVLACLRERPAHVHVVLTGREAPQELIDLADTVTEMSLIKHHYQAGVPAQRGIED